MAFHRFVDPSYFLGVGGSFPGTIFGQSYDRANVVSGGTGAGGSAHADAAKVGGPNAGTYWHAFGEDATSNFFNRGLKALSENTDYLDDLVHRDLAVPTRTADVVSSGQTSVVLPAGTWVGDDPSTDIEDLFAIVDRSGMHISLTTTGAYVKPASIVGATIGDGFSTSSITLNFSMAITAPMSADWHIVYGARSNMAVIPTGALVWPAIKSSEELHGAVQNVIKKIKFRQASASTWWTDPTKTIYDIAYSGLDDLYRLRTTVTFATPSWYPKASTLNTAAAGGWFAKDSFGMAGRAASSGYAIPNTVGEMDYALGAVWHAVNQDFHTVSTAYNRTGVSSGFVRYGRSFRSLNEDSASFPGMFGFGNFAIRSSTTTGSPNKRTHLIEGASFHIASATITAPANNWFYLVGSGTAIQLGLDVLVFKSGSSYINFVVTEVLDEITILVRCADGSLADIPDDDLELVHWLSPTFISSDSSGKFRTEHDSSPDVMINNSNVMCNLPLNYQGDTAFDLPALVLLTSANASALMWAEYSQYYGSFSPRGSLNADGGANFSGMVYAAGCVDASPTSTVYPLFSGLWNDNFAYDWLTALEFESARRGTSYGRARQLLYYSAVYNTFNASHDPLSWNPDNNTSPAYACGIDPSGPFIYSKCDTSAGFWGSWDDLDAAVGLGYKFVVFESTDTVTDYTGGSGWAQITRSSSPAGTLTVTFPHARQYHYIEASASVCVKPTVASKVFRVRLLYRINGGTWQVVPGSGRAVYFDNTYWQCIESFGIVRLTDANPLVNIDVSVWVKGDTGATWEYNQTIDVDTILRAKLYRLS